MKKLLIATTRKGKLAEFKDILKDLKFKFLTLKDIKFPNLEPKETGKTFAENAIIKAKFYGRKSGLLTLADDSGLIVKSLPAKLGIKSKRYAPGTDIDCYQKLLKEMKHMKGEQRQAKFIAAVCFFDPKIDKVKVTQGECLGSIAKQPKGKNGFGYDPIFIVKTKNKHFAQLTLNEKNQVSHRAKALKKMLKHLKKI
jgi:XTP/dITP diphosphohydrolase